MHRSVSKTGVGKSVTFPVDFVMDGVRIAALKSYGTAGGVLSEVWRGDWGDWVCRPAQVYVEELSSGVVKGPHEHRWQTDQFVFFGRVAIALHDARSDKKGGLGRHLEILDGSFRVPHLVTIPPGVVHAYIGLGGKFVVLNLPNRLYRGRERSGKVDEIRHEDLGTAKYSWMIRELRKVYDTKRS